MKTHTVVFVLLAACATLIGACSGGAEQADETRNASAAVGSSEAAADTGGTVSVDTRVIDANTDFALSLVQKTCGSDKTENLFISPVSVSVAVAMAYQGAAGKTAREMSDALGFTGIPTPELNRAMSDLRAALEHADSAVELAVANSLWANRGANFRAEFLDHNERFYGAKVATLDFSDPGAPAVINEWVRSSTNGLIDRMIESIPREAVLYLLNAIYFKGRWQEAFDPALTGDGEFHLVGGGVKTVAMMRRSGSFDYAEDAGLQVVRLPYGDGRISMTVFLPREPGALPVFVQGLDRGVLDGWTARLAHSGGEVIIPRFAIAYECALVDVLRKMGMRDPFDPSAADFSKMSEISLYISAVKHKSVVDVNEEGTEAAAVTSIEIRPTSVESPADRFTFAADRPFFFVIRDEVTGSLLFLGSVYDPSS